MSDTEQNALVAQILSSYLSNNTVAAADLPGVIASVKRAFAGEAMAEEPAAAAKTPEIREPVVSIKKSVTPDAIACLCCGETFKSLKRHLATAHDLTPSAYRAAFNLKADYPIVAPNYAKQRSQLAKSLGLGQKPKMEAAPKKRPGKTAPKGARTAA